MSRGLPRLTAAAGCPEAVLTPTWLPQTVVWPLPFLTSGSSVLLSRPRSPAALRQVGSALQPPTLLR